MSGRGSSAFAGLFAFSSWCAVDHCHPVSGTRGASGPPQDLASLGCCGSAGIICITMATRSFHPSVWSQVRDSTIVRSVAFLAPPSVNSFVHGSVAFCSFVLFLVFFFSHSLSLSFLLSFL